MTLECITMINHLEPRGSLIIIVSWALIPVLSSPLQPWSAAATQPRPLQAVLEVASV